MPGSPKLLIVDDEEVICRGCQRVFAPQGFQVEVSSDSRRGLELATEKDYDAILLDIMMPGLNGIEFLEELRKTKPDVPVVLITGYPSIPNAAAAMRFGAADYVTKPFSPEEITQAVQRLLRQGPVERKRVPSPPAVEPWAPPVEAFRFLDESWVQLGEEGSLRVGAVLTRSLAAGVEGVRLPGIGEVVYQGLPVAGLALTDKSLVVIPSPASGVVVAVNERLRGDPSPLLKDPCGEGWIVCVCPTRTEEEEKNCKPRRVLLVNADTASTEDQSRRLAALGCQVCVASHWDELAPRLEELNGHVVFIDAASFGESGPELAGRINTAAPSTKIVVVAAAGSPSEAMYRERRIFYYAVAPFADNEIVDILDAAFRSPRPAAPPTKRHEDPSDAVSRISIVNRNGKRVRLLAEVGLLQRESGLGWQIRRKLLDRLFPIETTPGIASIGALDILAAAQTCDRLLVLLAKDIGRVPGCLVRDTKAQFVSLSGEHAGKVTTLVVQPAAAAGAPVEFDARTTTSLAEHIVQEMASC